MAIPTCFNLFLSLAVSVCLATLNEVLTNLRFIVKLGTDARPKHKFPAKLAACKCYVSIHRETIWRRPEIFFYQTSGKH